jgi:peptidyl-prolyl cis-trans isomerase C
MVPLLNVASYFPLYLLCALAWVLSGCSAVAPTSPETTLARVNGEAITVELMETAFSDSHQGHSAFLAGQGVVRQVLEKVIDKELLLQEARRIDLDIDPEIESLVEKQRAARAFQRFFQDKVASQVVISPEAVASAHKRMSDRFQARHILVGSREEAQDLYDRVKAGAEFAQLAREVSQADTAVKGGHMGIVSWGRLDTELEDQLWSLELGEVSRPFETSEGWNLLYVAEKGSGKPPDLHRVTSQINSVLTTRERRRLSELLLRDLTVRWNARINNAALAAVLQARAEEPKLDLVLAEVGNEKITLEQIRPRVDWNKVRKLAAPVALRSLRSLIEENDLFRLLVEKEALAHGYGQRPEVVKEVEALRNKLAVDRLLSRVAFAGLDIDGDEALAYWDAHKERFTEKEAVQLSVVVLDSESEARQVLTDLQTGSEFAAVARVKSKDQASAQSGGALGWINKGSLQPDLERVAFSLKKAEPELIQSQGSYIVVLLDGRKPERLKPFSEVKEQARQLALEEKSRQRLKTWITKLREAAVIEIDEDAINRATAEYEGKFRDKAGQKHS